MPVSVDIVLPCYNPNDKWHLELLKFHASAKEHYRLNFILVNDGSSPGRIDQQIRELEKHQIIVNYIAYEKNRGKGFALRSGVSRSKSSFCLYTDIDFPFTDHSTLLLIHSLVSGQYDVVAGYREQEYYGKKMSRFRRSLSKAFRFFIKDILKMQVTDTQCGLKGFNAKGKEKFLATKTDRYLFDFEFIYSVCKDPSLKVQTVAAQLKDDVVFSKMKMRILLQEMVNLLSILLFRQ